MVAVVKSGNVSESKHVLFDQQYPLNSELRTTKLQQLKSSYEATNNLFVRSMTQQEKATEAYLRVAWVLGKNKKSFSDAEIVQECLDDILEAMFEGKEKQEMSEKLKQIPLSNCTSTRRRVTC